MYFQITAHVSSSLRPNSYTTGLAGSYDERPQSMPQISTMDLRTNDYHTSQLCSTPSAIPNSTFRCQLWQRNRVAPSCNVHQRQGKQCAVTEPRADERRWKRGRLCPS